MKSTNLIVYLDSIAIQDTDIVMLREGLKVKDKVGK